VSIPLYSCMGDAEVRYVIEKVRQFYDA